MDKIALIREFRIATKNRLSLSDCKSVLEQFDWNVKAAIEYHLGIPARVTRNEALEACHRLYMGMRELVPQNIDEISFLKMVAQDCFINRKTGHDVEVVRIGLRQLVNEGELTNDKGSK